MNTPTRASIAIISETVNSGCNELPPSHSLLQEDTMAIRAFSRQLELLLSG